MEGWKNLLNRCMKQMILHEIAGEKGISPKIKVLKETPVLYPQKDKGSCPWLEEADVWNE